MKTVHTIFLFFLMLVIFKSANAQFVDNYGIKLGVNFSNQYWGFDIFSNLSGWNEYKPGLSIYFNSETRLNKYLSIRPEIGYVQKGFTNEITSFPLSNSDESYITNYNVNFHNFSINLDLKFCPFELNIKPYLIAGFQGNYLLKYRSFDINMDEKGRIILRDILDNFNKFKLNGIIGIGLIYNDLFYFDIEYQPSITKKQINNYGLTVGERYFGFTLGLNINKLIDRG